MNNATARAALCGTSNSNSAENSDSDTSSGDAGSAGNKHILSDLDCTGSTASSVQDFQIRDGGAVKDRLVVGKGSRGNPTKLLRIGARKV